MLIRTVDSFTSSNTGATRPAAPVPLPAARTGADVQPVKPNIQPVELPSSANDVKAAVEQINKALLQSNRSLEFSIDERTQALVIKVKDNETGELIRQLPSDSALEIAQAIAQNQQLQAGALLEQKA